VRAASYTFIVIVAYCIITRKTDRATGGVAAAALSLGPCSGRCYIFLGPLPIAIAGHSRRLFLVRRFFYKGRPLLSRLDQAVSRPGTNAGRNRWSGRAATSADCSRSGGWRRYSIGRLDYFCA